MLLSALLTSVGINFGLCLLFCTLYSILRKQPINDSVYSPRAFAAKHDEEAAETFGFNFERLLPTAGWVKRAWKPTEDEFLSVTSLDAVVFMRIFIFSLRMFGFAAVIGLFVLLPINYVGTQLSVDWSDYSTISLDSFSISNVDDASNWLWVHFCAAYIFTGFVCYLLFIEYKYISLRRIAQLHSSKPQPPQFTVLVRNIPASPGTSYGENVDKFFTEYYSSSYLSHSMVRRTDKLQKLTKDTEKVFRKLARLKSEKNTEPKFKRDGFFGRKVNILDHYGKKLDELEDTVRVEQSSLAGKEEIPDAFVSFKSRVAAAVALHTQQGINPTEWVTESAPEPQDVHWPFFSSSFLKRFISKLVVVLACAAITILFLIPVAIVQALANLEQLETWFPFLTSILDLTVVSEIITGYLPSLILKWFLKLVPPVMILLSSMEGFISFSQIQKSACIKMLWFTVWNIFFANVLSGTALYDVDLLLEPKELPGLLADGVPAQASFFIAYVVTSGWTGIATDLFRMTPLICSYIKRLFSVEAKDEFEVPAIPYHSAIPKILFFGLLGVTYFLLAPLILPFLLVYCCMGYIIYRSQLLNVYAPKYDSGGRFWPIVHNSTIFSLVLMHVIAIGLFGIKELPVAASLTVPLPILTLIFNVYCSKRFLPIFKAYPIECLAKKDKEDDSDSTIDAFYDKLRTAYEDPALHPIQRPRSTDDLHSPLLSTGV